MPVVQPSQKIIELSQAANPKVALLNAVGDLSKEEVLYDLVLVGTYFRPEKTRGGIIRPADNVKEDAFQSKIGLVLKKGPDCTEGPKIEVGDWVVYSVGDGWALTVNDTPCRLVPYDRLRMKVSDPQKVF